MALRQLFIHALTASAVVMASVLMILRADADAVDHKIIPVTGDYLIYSGTLDDTRLPTPREAKAAIHLTGTLAQDLYRNLGPSAERESCNPAGHTRSRGDLECDLRGGKGPAECWIGIDIKRGRSIGGVIC